MLYPTIATLAKLCSELECLQDSPPRLSGTIFTFKESKCKCLVDDLGYVHEYKLTCSLVFLDYLEVLYFSLFYSIMNVCCNGSVS